MNYGLGRIAAPDPRDLDFLLTVPTSTRTSRFWWGYATYLDQGQTPQCTAYAWSHWYCDSPLTHSKPFEAPGTFYNEEQKIDGFPLPHEGSTVRAGAQVMQAKGRVTKYQWAFDLETVKNHLLEVGPLVVGTNWYDSMFDVVNGFVKIKAGSQIAGGHAYKLDGINTIHSFFRFKNSWGTSWGNHGYARISFADFTRLLSEDGEACKAVEV